jgi:hypothetical protein
VKFKQCQAIIFLRPPKFAFGALEVDEQQQGILLSLQTSTQPFTRIRVCHDLLASTFLPRTAGVAAKMGAGQSKPDESTKHVFASDTPIQFSQE